LAKLLIEASPDDSELRAAIEALWCSWELVSCRAQGGKASTVAPALAVVRWAEVRAFVHILLITTIYSQGILVDVDNCSERKRLPMETMDP
jgi:hypothetical protein